MNHSWHLVLLSLSLLTLLFMSSPSSSSLRTIISNSQTAPRTSNTTPMQQRSMVGGYSSIHDGQQLQELLPIANYALDEFITLQQSQSESSSIQLPSLSRLESKASSALTPHILTAQQQVVAGMNYKLFFAIYNTTNNECLGGVEVTVWRQLNQELKVTNWGKIYSCDELFEGEFGESLMGIQEKIEGGVQVEPEE